MIEARRSGPRLFRAGGYVGGDGPQGLQNEISGDASSRWLIIPCRGAQPRKFTLSPSWADKAINCYNFEFRYQSLAAIFNPLAVLLLKAALRNDSGRQQSFALRKYMHSHAQYHVPGSGFLKSAYCFFSPAAKVWFGQEIK